MAGSGVCVVPRVRTGSSLLRIAPVFLLGSVFLLLCSRLLRVVGEEVRWCLLEGSMMW